MNSKNDSAETRPWAEDVADEVISRNKKEFVCEGMWTPSGYFHIGNARPEIFTPYAVKKAIQDRGFKVRQNLIIDDFDAVRKIPEDLGIAKKDFEKYLGYPCATAPSPIPGYKTWGDAFISEVRRSIGEFGVELNIISAHETYQQGKFNDLIVFTLENAKEIVKVWKDVSGTDKNEEEFVPIQLVCEKCKRIYYTKITKWDGKKVSYECKCGHRGSVSPLNGNAKLHWRVHWVAHWILHEVDFESGGKDHFSKGGSVDVGRALMEKVFKKTPPVQVPTEFIQMAGQKMSGSKGNVISLAKWLSVASPELFRFMNFSYRPNTAIEFSLSDHSFILLNDRYDTAERIYYGVETDVDDAKIQKQKRLYEMAQIQKPNQRCLQVQYPFLASIAQLFDQNTQLENALTVFHQTGHLPGDLNKTEKEIIRKKLFLARNWALAFAPEQYKISFLPNPLALSATPNQKKTLQEIAATLPTTKTVDEIQQMIYETSRKNSEQPKDVFKLIYQSTIGKDAGPKVGQLAIAFGKEKFAKRLSEISQ